MQEFILLQLKKSDILIKNEDQKIDFEGLYASGINLEDLYKIAAQKGGKCLSDKFCGMFHKLKWQCRNGHIWESLPSNIKKGHWCPYCKGRGRTVRDMIELAKKKDGKFLSLEFTGMRKKYKWQCNHGHIWFATADSIKSGNWCSICSHKKSAETRSHDIEDMHKLAKARGMKFLSTKYVNARTNHKWQCVCGREWKTTSQSVKKGHNCRFCKNRKISNSLKNLNN